MATGLGVLTSLAILMPTYRAIAAERVVLTYRIFQRSISVEDLTTLAETGEASSGLRSYLRLAGRDPEELQTALNREVELNPRMLDRTLNSPLGNVALDELGKTIHTSSGEANRQALRSALVLSASDDRRVSLIEVLQNYPTNDVHIDGDRLVTAYRDIAGIVRIQQQVNDWLEQIL